MEYGPAKGKVSWYLRHLLVSCVLLAALVGAVSGSGAFTPRDRVVYSDLVVRGVIRSFTTETVAKRNYIPDTPFNPDGPFPITNLKVEVLEVINGVWSDQFLNVVLPGGFPDGVPDTTGITIHIDTLGYPRGYNYSVGDEMVVALYYQPYMKGGSFMPWTDEGRFMKTKSGWENLGTGEKSSLEEIRAMADDAELSTVLEEAELAGIGVIESINNEERAPFGVFEHIAIRPVDIWKGESVSDQITFEVIRRGGYSLPSRRPVPKLSEGEKWVFFLKKNEGGVYFPFAGTNGLLKFEDGKLVRNNVVPYKLNASELEKILSAEVRR